MAKTPTFTMRLNVTERAAMALLVKAGREGGRSGYTDSDAIRAALRFAAATPDMAFILAPRVLNGRPPVSRSGESV